MALYSTRTYDWQDLADDSVTWADWTNWTGNGVTINGSTGFDDLVHTTTAQDLGQIQDFYLTAQAISNGTNVIAVQVSDDDLSYTTVNPQTNPELLRGRYVKLQVTVTNATETARLDSITGQVQFDPQRETFNQLSVTNSGTTLPIIKAYSRILGITYSSAHKYQIVLTDTTATAPVVTSYNLDTWGKVAETSTADVTVIGFPTMTVSANGDIVLS